MSVTVPSQSQTRDNLHEVAKGLITLAEEINAGGATLPAFAAPVSIGTANAEGVATTLVRSDHGHDHGAQTDPLQHAVATTSANGFMSSADKAKVDSIQSGSDTLVAGTVTVAANITASSRIPAPGITDPGVGAITGLAALKITNKVVGAPGSFDVTAIDDTGATIATAVCVFEWLVVG
jgi:hypothetical protein